MKKTSASVASVVLLLLATTLGSQELFAQSADGDVQKSKTDKPAASLEPVAKPKEQPKTSSKGKEEDKSFIPSEEISEDFAVSFPVDI